VDSDGRWYDASRLSDVPTLISYLYDILGTEELTSMTNDNLTGRATS
jgi:hypothetical protein